MTGKAKRAKYTLEFKLEAVRLVKAARSMAAVAATPGMVEQTLMARDEIGRMRAAISVYSGRDLGACRRLISSGTAMDEVRLAEPSVSLRSLL